MRLLPRLLGRQPQRSHLEPTPQGGTSRRTFLKGLGLGALGGGYVTHMLNNPFKEVDIRERDGATVNLTGSDIRDIFTVQQVGFPNSRYPEKLKGQIRMRAGDDTIKYTNGQQDGLIVDGGRGKDSAMFHGHRDRYELTQGRDERGVYLDVHRKGKAGQGERFYNVEAFRFHGTGFGTNEVNLVYNAETGQYEEAPCELTCPGGDEIIGESAS